MWELIILPACHSYYLCDIFFVVGHRRSFLCRFLPSLSIVVQQLVVILVFSRGRGELRSSAPLSCLLNLAMSFPVLLLQARSTSPHPDLVSDMWLAGLTECGLKVSVSQFLGLKRHHVSSLAPFCF